MGAYGFVLFRVVISTLVFWIIYFFNQEKINWKADGLRLFLCAITGVGINMLLFFKGIGMTTAVNGSMIMTLTPLLVMLWSRILLKEKISLIKILGIVIGLIGAIIIVYDPNNVNVKANWVGDLLILINGTSYAVYLVLVKPLMKTYQPLTIVTWIFTFGLMLVVPVGFNEAAQLKMNELPLQVILASAYSIFFVTVIVYFLNIWTLTKVNPTVVGAFVYLQPVFATLTAILFFDEVFLMKHLIASIFIFLGVFLVTKKSVSVSPKNH